MNTTLYICYQTYRDVEEAEVVFKGGFSSLEEAKKAFTPAPEKEWVENYTQRLFENTSSRNENLCYEIYEVEVNKVHNMYIMS